MGKKIILLLLLLFYGEMIMAFTLASTAFKDGESIPKTYTCDGADVSPPLKWSDPPQATQSFALIVDDPDAPSGTWNHWILFNIPNNISELAENLKTLPPGAIVGKNSFGRTAYNGPCPPDREHRYMFKLYALDSKLDLKSGVTKNELESSMNSHILGTAQLMGQYKRSGK